MDMNLDLENDLDMVQDKGLDQDLLLKLLPGFGPRDEQGFSRSNS